METKKRLSNSVRKYIRLQKALIRKGSFDSKKQEELISNLYKKYSSDIINEDTKKEESLKPKKIEKKSKKHEVQKNKAKRQDK